MNEIDYSHGAFDFDGNADTGYCLDIRDDDYAGPPCDKCAEPCCPKSLVNGLCGACRYVPTKLDGWIAGSLGQTRSYYSDQIIELGWQAGQVGHITQDRVHYEKFDLDGGYVVVEWDDYGNVGVI